MAAPGGSSNAVRVFRLPAVRGSLITAAILLIVSGLRGGLDLWWLAAATVAALTGALLAGMERRRPAPAPVAAREERLFAADTLLASIPDPVVLVDRRAVVRQANEAARGLLPALRIGHPLSFSLRSPDVLGGIEKVLKTGVGQTVGYSERIPAQRSFEVQIGALKSAHDETDAEAGVVLFFRDQTSARRLEHMRVDFIANASHELRTPLASVLGFIETLRAKTRPPASAFLRSCAGRRSA